MCRGFGRAFESQQLTTEVTGCEGSLPRWDEGKAQQIFSDTLTPTDPLSESWLGQQTTCDKIVVVASVVKLEDVAHALERKCQRLLQNSLYKVGTLQIVAHRVYVSENMEIFGLRELRIDSRLLLVKSAASKLELKQSAARDGQNARGANFNGYKGDDGGAGAEGTKVIIKATKAVTEGPFVISVQGGDGGRGGDGSEGKQGAVGVGASDPPRYTNEEWAKEFLKGSPWECTSCAFGALFDGIRHCPGGCWGHIPRNPGGKGNTGGKGGSGGAGGKGGNSGSISVSADALEGDLLIRVIPGEGGRGGAGARGGQGGLGGQSSEGMSLSTEDEWCGGDDDNHNNHCYHHHLDKFRAQSGSPGAQGTSGNSGQTGDVLTADSACPLNVDNINVKLLKVMEVRYEALKHLRDGHEFQKFRMRGTHLGKEVLVGSQSSKIKYEADRGVLDAISGSATTTHILATMAQVFRNYHSTVTRSNMELIRAEITMLEGDQKLLEDGIQHLFREQEMIQNELPVKIRSAFDTKLDAAIRKKKADETAAAIQLAFTAMTIGSSAQLKGINDAVVNSFKYAPKLIAASKTLSKGGVDLGCDVIPMVKEFAEKMAKHHLGESNLDQTFLEEAVQNATHLNEVKRFENLRSQHSFKRMVFCILAQNIDFQKEPTVEAAEVENLIDEYFDADDKMLDLSEKFIEKAKRLTILREQSEIAGRTTLEDYGNKDSNKMQIMVDYSDMEFVLFHNLALYVSHLENKHATKFQTFSSLLKEHLSMGLQLPFSRNKVDLAKINSQVESWFADQKFEPVPSNRVVHFKFESPRLLRKLEEDFNVTLSVPISKSMVEGGEIVGDGSYFNSNPNIRLTGASARLAFKDGFGSFGPGMPPKVWVWINQHQIHKLRINGNVFEYKLYKPSDAFETVKSFGVAPPDVVSGSQEQMTRNDCCLKRCTGSETFCPSPFADYTLSIPQGKQVACPQNEDHHNCKGISLRGLKAIHLYVKYSSVPEKLEE